MATNANVNGVTTAPVTAASDQTDIIKAFKNRVVQLEAELTALRNIQGTVSESDMDTNGEYQEITSAIDGILMGTDGLGTGLISLMTQIQNSTDPTVAAFANNPNSGFQNFRSDIFGSAVTGDGLAQAAEDDYFSQPGTLSNMAQVLATVVDQTNENFLLKLIADGNKFHN